MTTFSVALSSVEQVKQFSDAAVALACDIDICSGRYRLNAKSMMGLFSLDLGKPVTVEVMGSNPECEAFRRAIAPLIIE